MNAAPRQRHLRDSLSIVVEMKKESPFMSDERKELSGKKNKCAMHCASCDKMFKFKSDFGVHVESVHNRAVFTVELDDRGRLKCFYCGDRVKQVKRHFMSNHKNLGLDSNAVEELCKKLSAVLRRKAQAVYDKSDKGKAAKARAEKTEKRKEAKAAYKRTEKGMNANAKFEHTEKRRETKRAYKKGDKGMECVAKAERKRLLSRRDTAEGKVLDSLIPTDETSA